MPNKVEKSMRFIMRDFLPDGNLFITIQKYKLTKLTEWVILVVEGWMPDNETKRSEFMILQTIIK